VQVVKKRGFANGGSADESHGELIDGAKESIEFGFFKHD
jgi:hypothetical protein